MIKEKNIENGVRIFCIFFKNKEKKYDFGKIEGKVNMTHMLQIILYYH